LQTGKRIIKSWPSPADVEGSPVGVEMPARNAEPIREREVLMVRATFFSLGLFVTMWGVAFLFADKIVLYDNGEKLERDKNLRGMLTHQQVEKDVRRVFDPPDWAAFSLLSIGSVTVLYSVALPRPCHHHL
jgi:hypothetical protein